MKILIMGIPDSDRIALAQALKHKLIELGRTADWYDSDHSSDQNFGAWSQDEQALYMRKLANASESDFVICDFVAATHKIRDNFAADYTVWVDTIQENEYADTNQIFEKPKTFNTRIAVCNLDFWVDFIVNQLQ
jgi:hypothetical protein